MDVLTGLTLAAPAGVNAYIPLLAVALAERFGWLHVDAPYNMLGSWWAIALVGVLLVVEVVADNLPAVGHANDAAQTVVRPAAGGLLAMAASGQGAASSALLLVAGILIAGGVHAVKASARPAVKVSTAGIGAPVASTIEDAGALVVRAVVVIRRWRRRWRGGGAPAPR